MANWAITDYVIEGPKDTLEKIHEAILHHPIAKDSSDRWEGNILNALDIKWASMDDNMKRGFYMRGYILENPWWEDDTHTVLRLSAEEAWGATDFNEALESAFPDIKVFYSVEEQGEEIYATNDKEGKYFPQKYYVDTCIDGEYQSDYFVQENTLYKWLSKITHGRVNSKEEAEKFNDDYKDSDAFDENYIYIHEFQVIE